MKPALRSHKPRGPSLKDGLSAPHCRFDLHPRIPAEDFPKVRRGKAAAKGYHQKRHPCMLLAFGRATCIALASLMPDVAPTQESEAAHEQDGETSFPSDRTCRICGVLQVSKHCLLVKHEKDISFSSDLEGCHYFADLAVEPKLKCKRDPSSFTAKRLLKRGLVSCAG